MIQRLLAAALFLTSLQLSGQTSSPRLLDYDVKYYWLDLNLDNTSANITGRGTIGAVVTASTDTFAFQLHNNYTIDSIRVNGQNPVNILSSNGLVKVRLGSKVFKNSFLK